MIITAQIDDAYAQAKSLLEKLQEIPTASQINALGSAGSDVTAKFETALERAAVFMQSLVVEVEQKLSDQADALRAAAQTLDEANAEVGVSASQLDEQVALGVDAAVVQASENVDSDQQFVEGQAPAPVPVTWDPSSPTVQMG